MISRVYHCTSLFAFPWLIMVLASYKFLGYNKNSISSSLKSYLQKVGQDLATVVFTLTHTKLIVEFYVRYHQKIENIPAKIIHFCHHKIGVWLCKIKIFNCFWCIPQTLTKIFVEETLGEPRSSWFTANRQKIMIHNTI